MTLLILIVTSTGADWPSIEVQRVISALASFLTVLKIFDWLRLFEETAFYVLLVQETLWDIRFFMLLLLTTLLMFGVPLVLLQGSSPAGKELIDSSFGYWMIDLFFNQYMVALGDFSTDTFADHP